MFVLNPDGIGASSTDRDNSGSSNPNISFARQQFQFFGIQLGLYFLILRGAYYYFAITSSTPTGDSSSSSNANPTK
jgi:hypothetical protein